MHKFIQTILLLVCFVFATNTQAQIINIPDANFKEILLQANTSNSIAGDSLGNSIKIDINNNQEIELNEALNVYYLSIQYNNIIDSVNGIEFFTNLTGLRLEDLDLSPNREIKSVNINNLVNLKTINIINTGIQNLELSMLINLEYLYLTNNLLSSLDLRFNRKLITLRCEYNRLTSLNLELCDSLYSVLCQGNLLTNIN
ncbi:MAG: T9SS C-terminal target domain-containing protein, partial [Chitinophagales bacterium]|nr:T9SS C-terminal target domain-containing protein [Chitinophagales bacterium]